MAQIGLEYGPAFQGLEAAWRLGEEIYAEISLAEEQEGESGYRLHPALLDAALHTSFLGVDPGQGASLPFAFAGVSIDGDTGPTALRVRIAAEGGRIRLQAADQDGRPIAEVEVLVRPVELGAGTPRGDALFVVEWVEQDLAAGEDEPELVRCAAEPGQDPAAASHVLAAAVLERLQAELAKEEPTRLAFLTEGAMALDPSEAPHPALAAVWGLVRSAQSEHPGRFLLIDSDGSEASAAALAAALAQTEEPQLALREGVARVPRLARAGEADPAASAPAEDKAAAALDPEGTVLITGGLSGLGALTARHLAGSGAKHLLLTSRRGPDAPGAEELIAELGGLGCEATAVACDVADRARVEELIAAVPDAHPLTAVIHSAGVLDDGTILSLDAARLDAALAPKADAAWNLHEATRGLDLAAFVLFSSAAAALGSPGQGNYAAANSFLDGLAARRRSEGLPSTAIAWSLWEEGGMGAELAEGDRARLARSGLVPISTEEAFELLERARALPHALALAVPLDLAVLRGVARLGVLPPIFSGLVKVNRRRAKAASGSLARRLAAISPEKRSAVVLASVREQAAAVLGHASGESVDPDASFKDLGFDSLGAVELRNRLTQATGVPLDATLVFDYPTATALAGYLLDQIEGAGGADVRRPRPPATATSRSRSSASACRYPGGVASPRGLWRLLADGVDAITEFPADRGWDVERPLRPRPRATGHHLHPPRRLPARRRRVRPGVLRHQPARGAGDGPAAAAAAGRRLGGAGGRRDRPGATARQRHRGLRRHDVPPTTATGGESSELEASPSRASRPASPPAGSPTRSGWRARR